MTVRTGKRAHGANFQLFWRGARLVSTHTKLCTSSAARMCTHPGSTPVGNHFSGGVETGRPCVCKTRCNRASPRFRQPPGLSRHDLDSPTQRAHSCNWALGLKHDGSHWDTRARCGFHVRTAVCVHRRVQPCARWCVHQPGVQPANQPTSCAQNTVQPSVAAVPVTSRAVRTRSE